MNLFVRISLVKGILVHRDSCASILAVDLQRMKNVDVEMYSHHISLLFCFKAGRMNIDTSSIAY